MFLKKVFLILFSVLFYQIQAQERILDFDVKVQIEKTGVIHVVENITIKAEQNQFRHGLLRVLPLTREDNKGNQIDVEYIISSIKKNGKEEQYFTESERNDWKIYIGNKDVVLEHGVYQYEISYSVPFQIGYFDDYDELYWNVTGNGWYFPIDNATCQISLPSENNRFQNLHCYTGKAGSTSSNCTSSLNSKNTVVTFSANNLRSTEGLTVAASFEKGIVDQPTFLQELRSYYKLIKEHLWSVVFILGMFIFFFLSWRKHGKEPDKKTIIPEFLPPFDFSPAIVGYVYQKKLKEKTYMASLINMAVKVAIRICPVLEDGVFTNTENYEIHVLDKELKTLSTEESEIARSFSKKKIKVNDSNHRIFGKAYSNWSHDVTRQINLDGLYEKNNSLKWIGFSIFLSAGLAYEMLSKTEGYINYVFYSGLVVVLSALTYFFSKKESGEGIIILKIFVSFFVFLPAIFIFLVTMSFLNDIQIGTIVFVFFMYIIYVWNISRKTEKGAEVISRLKGFKLYLETAEKDRMNLLNPPELTPQLFEKLFPYAIALNVEIVWGKQFEEILEQAKYNPEWYQGDDSFYVRPTMFLSGLANSVSSAAVNPNPSRSSSSSSSSSGSGGSSGSSGSWSSGSSGRGSSGGGGGGGGGGGW